MMSNELTKGGDSRELSEDINVITAEINAYQRVAGEAIFEIGRRLKHVKENDLAHGEWAKWCEGKIGMTTQYANRFIRVFDRFSNRNPGFSFAKVTLSTLNALIPFTDEELSESYELPSGEKKKPTEMSRRQIEELKRQLKQERERVEQLEKEKDAERGERERLEEEIEKTPKIEVRTEYIEKETPTPYDRTYDDPYTVERGNDFYKMMGEVDELYKKYAHLKDGIDELRGIAVYDDDLKLKYRKADEFWRMLGDIFNERNNDIIDVEII